MHPQWHKKYYMRPSRKRSRGQYQNECTLSLEPPKLTCKGNGPLDPKFLKPKAIKEENFPSHSMPIWDKENEPSSINGCPKQKILVSRLFKKMRQLEFSLIRSMIQ